MWAGLLSGLQVQRAGGIHGQLTPLDLTHMIAAGKVNFGDANYICPCRIPPHSQLRESLLAAGRWAQGSIHQELSVQLP